MAIDADGITLDELWEGIGCYEFDSRNEDEEEEGPSISETTAPVSIKIESETKHDSLRTSTTKPSKHKKWSDAVVNVTESAQYPSSNLITSKPHIVVDNISPNTNGHADPIPSVNCHSGPLTRRKRQSIANHVTISVPHVSASRVHSVQPNSNGIVSASNGIMVVPHASKQSVPSTQVNLPFSTSSMNSSVQQVSTGSISRPPGNVVQFTTANYKTFPATNVSEERGTLYASSSFSKPRNSKINLVSATDQNSHSLPLVPSELPHQKNAILGSSGAPPLVHSHANDESRGQINTLSAIPKENIVLERNQLNCAPSVNSDTPYTSSAVKTESNGSVCDSTSNLGGSSVLPGVENKVCNTIMKTETKILESDSASSLISHDDTGGMHGKFTCSSSRNDMEEEDHKVWYEVRNINGVDHTNGGRSKRKAAEKARIAWNRNDDNSDDDVNRNGLDEGKSKLARLSQSAWLSDESDDDVSQECTGYTARSKTRPRIPRSNEEHGIDTYFVGKVRKRQQCGKIQGFCPVKIAANVITSVVSNRHRFECKICKFNLYDIGKMVRHSIAHLRGTCIPRSNEEHGIDTYFVEKVRKQQQCGKIQGFCPVKIAANVITSVESNRHRFECKICKFNSYDIREMTSHSIAHLRGTRFNCEKCGRVFKSEHFFEIHQDFHRLGMWREVEGSGSRHFTCKKCHLFFDDSNSLAHHQEKHKNEKLPYQCGVCDKVFPSGAKRQRHEFTHKIKGRYMKCPHCPTTCANSYSLKLHVEAHKHYDRKIDAYRCETCEAVFTGIKDYVNHQNNHKDRSIACDRCGKLYSTRMYLELHQQACAYSEGMAQHVPKVKHFFCDKCGRVFKNERFFQIHQDFHRLGMWRDVEGSGTRCFTCKMCHKFFDNLNSLSHHQEEHKDETLPYHCGVCDKAFRCASRRQRHELTHKIKDWYLKCPHCPALLANSVSLKLHTEAHTSYDQAVNGYRCKKCDAVFTGMQKYLRHQNLHKESSHACERCGEVFSTRRQLEHVHRLSCVKRMNGMEKIHTCEVCGKTFGLAFIMRRHMRIHSGEKPFKCRHCSLSFNQMGARTRHEHLHFKGGEFREVMKHNIKVKKGKDGRIYN